MTTNGKPPHQPRSCQLHGRPKEQGVILLMTLLCLFLIAAVAAAIILMAGMESSLVGNQRVATQVHFAAQSGLEEAEGRIQHPGSAHPGPYTPHCCGGSHLHRECRSRRDRDAQRSDESLRGY